MAEVTGFIEMQQRLKRMAASIKFEAARALYEEALIEMEEAKKRTPVDTGALRDSGIVDLPQILNESISVKLHFGSTPPSNKYALFVHEDLEAFHPVGEAKFLESTLQESAPYMKERVARRIDLNKVVNG
jgi:hypothetical protein